MLRNLKLTLLTISSLFMFSIPLLMAGATVSAVTIEECLSQGGTLELGTDKTCTRDPNAAQTGTRLTNFISDALNVLSIIVGVVAVIMIIVGGFRYIASGGKAESITSAKNIILYAIVGLIIVALAQVVVRFIIQRAVVTTP